MDHSPGYASPSCAEWELFRVGLSTLWDDIESQPDDEEPGTTEAKFLASLAVR